MQFRNFTWPNEPSSLRVTSRRRTALLEEPGGGWTLQDLGTAARTVTGEGVFFGETAYESLRTLEALLAQGGAGAGEAGFDRSGGDAEHAGDFVYGVALRVVQRQAQSERFGQG